METFILIVLFYLFLSLISFVFVYANDTADIANNDFKTYEPSIFDLSEEERASICTIDNYIKNTICPRYHHQILKNEINHYQNEGLFFIPFFIVNLNLSGILIKTLGIEKWFTLFWVVAIITGYACYFVVWLIYKRKNSSVRIKDYYEIHSSYDWKSHYDYLCSIKKNVVFRYMLRNIICTLAVLCFIAAMYYKQLT